ncbi:MAG: LysM peptidoglycan-binding domain-containing protein [Thermoflexales bacterium]|nr:LysM peptidoglycan-binding domain-containing protein [Thermoflexales bacterium]
MQTSSAKATRRCPSCSSKIAAEAAICPICGQASDPIIVVVEPEHAAPAQAALPPAAPTLRGRLLNVARRLPWGVIGVVGVIGLLALGAGSILESGFGAAAPPTLTATPAPTATRQPTNTPRPTLTPPPTATRPPAATATVAPRATYVVRFGDTCGSIAADYSISVDTLTDYNDISTIGGGCFIVEGAKLLIPGYTPTVGPTPTLRPGETREPTATPQPTATLPPQLVYEVKPGDVCGIIAERFRIPVRQIIQQNKLDEDCSITIGQRLTLIFATPTPSITNTPIIAQTPTPRTGYAAPQLTAPLDGETITATEDTLTLRWLSSGLLRENEWYVVQVQPAGATLVPIFETKATSLRLATSLLGGLEQQSFAWWVQVKELVAVDPVTGARTYRDVSPPSAARRFVWRPTRGAPPTAPPTR